MQEKLMKALFLSMFCFCSASIGYFTHTVIDYVSNSYPSIGEETRTQPVRVYNQKDIMPAEDFERKRPPMAPRSNGALAVVKQQAPSKANNVRDEHLLNPLIVNSIE